MSVCVFHSQQSTELIAAGKQGTFRLESGMPIGIARCYYNNGIIENVIFFFTHAKPKHVPNKRHVAHILTRIATQFSMRPLIKVIPGETNHFFFLFFFFSFRSNYTIDGEDVNNLI